MRSRGSRGASSPCSGSPCARASSARRYATTPARAYSRRARRPKSRPDDELERPAPGRGTRDACSPRSSASAAEALALARWMAGAPRALARRARHERALRRLSRARAASRSSAAWRGSRPPSWRARGAAGARCARRCSPRWTRCPRSATPAATTSRARRACSPRSALAARAAGGRARACVVVGCPAEEIGVGKRRLVAAGRLRGRRRRDDGARLRHAARAPALPRQPQVRVRVPRPRRARGRLSRARHQRARRRDRALRRDRPAAPAAPARRAHPRHRDATAARRPNVIPERAAARIWVRALEDAVLDDAAARVLRCAEGAAAATGTRLEVIPDESASPPLRPNLALAGGLPPPARAARPARERPRAGRVDRLERHHARLARGADDPSELPDRQRPPAPHARVRRRRRAARRARRACWRRARARADRARARARARDRARRSRPERPPSQTRLRFRGLCP